MQSFPWNAEQVFVYEKSFCIFKCWWQNVEQVMWRLMQSLPWNEGRKASHKSSYHPPNILQPAFSDKKLLHMQKIVSHPNLRQCIRKYTAIGQLVLQWQSWNQYIPLYDERIANTAQPLENVAIHILWHIIFQFLPE